MSQFLNRTRRSCCCTVCKVLAVCCVLLVLPVCYHPYMEMCDLSSRIFDYSRDISARNVFLWGPTCISPWKRKCSPTDYLPRILVLINSAVDHFQHRALIRITLGNPKWRRKLKLVVFFLLAKPTDNVPDVQAKVRREAWEFGDIIQGNFHDEYHSMARKVLLGMHWMWKYCMEIAPHIEYLLKTDDDAYIDWFWLLDELLHLKAGEKSHTILCPAIINGTPVRNTTGMDGKWYISEEDYADKIFPPFCHGLLYLLSRDLVFPMYHHALHVAKYIWLEDVFLTGLVPASLPYNVTFVNWKQFYKDTTNLSPGEEVQDASQYIMDKLAMIGHLKSLRDRARLWADMVADNELLSILLADPRENIDFETLQYG